MFEVTKMTVFLLENKLDFFSTKLSWILQFFIILNSMVNYLIIIIIIMTKEKIL